MLQVLQSTVRTEENLFTSTGINIIYAFIIFLKKNKTTDNIKFFFTPCRVVKASVDSVKVISRMEGEGVSRESKETEVEGKKIKT